METNMAKFEQIGEPPDGTARGIQLDRGSGGCGGLVYRYQALMAHEGNTADVNHYPTFGVCRHSVNVCREQVPVC
jgi:hypothetical protein